MIYFFLNKYFFINFSLTLKGKIGKYNQLSTILVCLSFVLLEKFSNTLNIYYLSPKPCFESSRLPYYQNEVEGKPKVLEIVSQLIIIAT